MSQESMSQNTPSWLSQTPSQPPSQDVSQLTPTPEPKLPPWSVGKLKQTKSTQTTLGLTPKKRKTDEVYPLSAERLKFVLRKQVKDRPRDKRKRLPLSPT
jgi:hypothetical protein